MNWIAFEDEYPLEGERFFATKDIDSDSIVSFCPRVPIPQFLEDWPEFRYWSPDEVAPHN